MTSETARKLSFPTKTAFGVGQVAEGVKNTAFAAFFVFFYNQVMGVSGTLCGAAVFIAMCFDAITDPLAGSLSDKLESRWGRRHPFILAAAVPLALTFIGLFIPPRGLGEWGLFIWMTTFAILVRGAMTSYHIPHLALGAEMARDYDERTSVFAYSTIFGWLGGLSTSILGNGYFFRTTEKYNPGTLNPEAYTSFAVFFSVTMLVVIAWCAWGTRGEIPHLPKPERKPPPFSPRQLLRELASVFSNRSFLTIFFGLMLGALILSIETVLGPYMGVHFWGFRTEQLPFLALGAAAGIPISALIAKPLTKLLDKRNTLVVTILIAVVNANIPIVLKLTGVIPGDGSTWLLYFLMGFSFIGGAIAPVIFIVINSIFADICDDHELRTGERQEGILFATRAFALKATNGLGALLGGIVIDVIRFPIGAAQGTVPDDVLFNLGLAQGPLTSIFTLCGLALYAMYKLDRKRVAEIQAALAERHRESRERAAEAS